MKMSRIPSREKAGLKKGPWTDEEDQKLIDHIQNHGPGNWRALPNKAGLQRCGKSCRLRWTNYLRPDIKRGQFSDEEEESIIHFHSILGNKWSTIAAKLPGRTDNEIKNYWNTHIRKKLLGMGIDPVTHGPRLDLLHLPSILSSLLNPQLLQLATSITSSQNEFNLSQNSFNNNSSSFDPILQQFVNQIDQTRVQNHPCFDLCPNNLAQNPSKICNIKTEQEKNHVNSSLSNIGYSTSNWHDDFSQGRLYPSWTNNNKSSEVSSVLSSPCSSSVDPNDASLMYLNSSNDNNEIDDDCFFRDILKKLENPSMT